MNEILDKLDRENLKIASFAKRFVAYVIDCFILSVIVFIIFFEQMSNAKDPNDLVLIINNISLGFVLLQFVYHLIFTFLYGASLGKIFCKIAIVDELSLDKPNFIQSAIRSGVRQLSDMAFALGFFWALGNDLRKTWHDYAAKTLVIELA